MLRNHLKFAVRTFLKDKVYSILNILGLTLGISVGIILLLYLQSELNYDAQHLNKDRIYRITHLLKAPGAEFNVSTTARELAPILKEEITDVEEYVRFNKHGNTKVEIEDVKGIKQQFFERKIFDADSSFLKVFSHKVLQGSATGCLSGPDKVVLTARIAKKYFGIGSAIGQTITFSEDDHRVVTAVIDDLPDNSHLKYEILLSEVPKREWAENAEGSQRKSEVFWNPSVHTYLLMSENYEIDKFKESFIPVNERCFKSFGDKISGTVTPNLQLLTDIHFNSDLDGDFPVGNIQYVYAFALVGLFIIILACINYMNLATSRSVLRTQEISIRKVLGDTKLNLFASVMLEAIVLSLIALILSYLTCYVVFSLTPFNDWIDKQLSLNFSLELMGGSLGLAVIIGAIAGVYPAIYIPSLEILSSLKGKAAASQKSGQIRKVLIVVQFSISIFVIMGTIMMSRQIEFLKSSDLGFNPDNVMLIDLNEEILIDKMDAFRSSIKQFPNVISSTTSWGIPGEGLGSQVYKVEQENGELLQQEMPSIYAGKDYLKTMGYELLAGRDFITDSEVDFTKAYIINEAAVKALSWTDNPLNKKIRFFHGSEDGRVIGVVKNFNFESLHHKIAPLFILLSRDDGGTLQIRLAGNGLQQSIQNIQQAFEEMFPGFPFEYRFLDEEFDLQYRADQIQQQLISSLSYLSIFISLLGLIGLSAFTAGQKAKEISIRKSLGASVPQILFMFSKGYIKLILIALAIGIPLADYVIVGWMSAFAYQSPIAWYIYLYPGLLVLLAGLITVMVQSWSFAKANPVDGLRSE